MSDYYVSDRQNMSIASSLLPVINSHANKFHPEDVIPSTNISLKSLKHSASVHLNSPLQEYSDPTRPTSLVGFSNTSLMTAEVYVRRATDTNSDNGNIYIRPRYGSGKYILSWYRYPQSTSTGTGDSPGTIKFNKNPSGYVAPRFYTDFSTDSLYTDTWVYDYFITNTGTATWSYLQIEILNLNSPDITLKNYLVASCRQSPDPEFCTASNTGKYIDPVTREEIFTINNWVVGQGSLTGTTFYNKKIAPNATVRFAHNCKMNYQTNPNGARDVRGYPRNAWKYLLDFKITPIVTIPPPVAGQDPLAYQEIRYPSISSTDAYFEEGAVISTATYYPAINGISAPGLNVNLNDLSGTKITKNSTTSEVLNRIKNLDPVNAYGFYGYKGTVDSNPPTNSTNNMVLFSLTDYTTGHNFKFVVRTGIDTTGGFSGYTVDNSLQSFSSMKRQIFQTVTMASDKLFPNPISVNYPGDDGAYSNISNIPYW